MPNRGSVGHGLGLVVGCQDLQPPGNQREQRGECQPPTLQGGGLGNDAGTAKGSPGKWATARLAAGRSDQLWHRFGGL